MASHYSTDAAPADNQAFAQPFDETKATGRKGELRPDDAKLSDDALVIWPSPDVQTGLDYDAMGQQLCQEYTILPTQLGYPSNFQRFPKFLVFTQALELANNLK